MLSIVLFSWLMRVVSCVSIISNVFFRNSKSSFASFITLLFFCLQLSSWYIFFFCTLCFAEISSSSILVKPFKPNKAIGFLCKIRHFVPKFLLRTLYHTILHFHLIYACQIWGQNINTLNKIQALQDKAVWIINFRANNNDVGELYKMIKCLDFQVTSNF